MNYKQALEEATKKFQDTNKNVYIFEVRKLNNYNFPEFIVSDTDSIIITSDSVAELIKSFINKGIYKMSVKPEVIKKIDEQLKDSAMLIGTEIIFSFSKLNELEMNILKNALELIKQAHDEIKKISKE